MNVARAAFGFLLAGSVALCAGCAATVKNAAKSAAPAAVESSVKQAKNPELRDSVAKLLGDPEIRSASAKLSQSVTDGILDSLTEKERVGRAEATSDAFVEHMSQTLAHSLARDLGPAVSSVVADSVERTLDANVEARLELMARAVARGSVEGAAEGVNAHLENSGPALDALVQRISRTAGREAALGFRDAVATSAAREKAGTGTPDDVLAVAGRTSGALLIAFRCAAWLLVLAATLIALSGIVWAIRRLRRPPGDRGTHTPAPAE
jgi:hypothetical protein